MSALPTYRVTVTREGRVWAAVVDGLPRGVVGTVEVEHAAQLDREVREAIADLTGATPADFWVQWSWVQDGRDYSEVVLGLEAWKTQADESTATRDAYRAVAIASMRRAGLSQRDVADLIGISHQRVSQLEATVRGEDGVEFVPVPPTVPEDAGLAFEQARRELDDAELDVSNSGARYQSDPSEETVAAHRADVEVLLEKTRTFTEAERRAIQHTIPQLTTAAVEMINRFGVDRHRPDEIRRLEQLLTLLDDLVAVYRRLRESQQA